MKAETVKHKANYEYNLKMDKNCPLPKGDHMYYFGQGKNVGRKNYPDQPSEIQKAQDKNINDVNRGSTDRRN